MGRVDTCPKCGALITPQLVRCRQCKTYLHGTKLEGFLFEHLLPKSLAASPGTGIIFLMIVLFYVLMGMLAGPIAMIAMTGYNVDQLGSTQATGIFQGQYWRFVTSMFGHHDLIHIAFNLYALTVIGPLVEELYDRKKMMLIYFVTGVSSMMISFVFHVEFMGAMGYGSIGASGAACGLMGACLAGSIRLGPEGRNVKRVMIRWGIYMVVWGALMSGIDNAAHFGGFLTGMALAYVMPLGGTQTTLGHKLLSVVTMSFVGLVIACTALMIDNLRGYPVSLEKDAGGRNIFFFEIEPGTEPDYSSQLTHFQSCAIRIKTADFSDEAKYDCELAARAWPTQPVLFRALAHFADRDGDTKRAARLRYTALRLERRL